MFLDRSLNNKSKERRNFSMALSNHDGVANISYLSSTGSSSLRKLCALLRNEGHRVLSGNSAFTLTTEVLAHINGDCRRHSVTELENLPAGNGGGSFLAPTKRMQEQQQAIKARTEWAVCIQFIKDFMLSTPSLKVLHNSCTLSAPISLHRFGNLSCLHLRRVPIHMVEGLQQLRCTLSSITIYRCVDKLKDLLESCGGDMSAPMTWPALKFVSFMFNSLSSLDDSLRLLPFVEVLDLSHNSLETCATHLEFLGDVISITLAYNSLVTIPSFSVSTRSSLTFLILRGNNLDRINGVEVLITLQELDLGENCLNDHSFLEPFSALVKLKQLQLDGNPIFYHRFHRRLTLSCLAKQAVNTEFELDKKKLSQSEISHFMQRRRPAKSLMETPSYPTRAKPHNRTPDRDSVYGMSPSSGIGTENESTDIVVTPGSIKKGKRKRLKARNTRILDMDTSGDVSSGQDGTPGTSPALKSFEEQLNARREEARKTQKEIEDLRQHYGPNWLQAIEDRNIFNTKRPVPLASTAPLASSSPSTSSDAEITSSKRRTYDRSSVSKDAFKNSDEGSRPQAEPGRDVSPTDDELYLRDTNLNDSINPIMAAIARMAAGESADESRKSLAIIEKDPTQEPWQSDVIAKPKDEDSKVNLASSHPMHATGSENNTLVDNKEAGSLIDGHLKSSAEADVKSPPRLESQLSRNLKNHVPSDKASSNNQILSKNVETPPLKRTSRDTSLSSLADPSLTRTNKSTDSCLPTFDEEEMTEVEMTEAMFISLPLENDKMIIVSVTDRSLIEKDIRMILREKLDLSTLTYMETKSVKKKKSSHFSGEVIEQTDEREEEIEVMQIDLKFDYMRKDRQTKCYHLDAVDAKILISHLQPFLDAREEEAKAKSMVVMQCLKCNRTFLKSEVVHQRQQLPTSGSSRDMESLQELMDKTTFICPKCGSSIVIELESAISKRKSQGSTSSTPAGSYTSAGSFIEQANKISNPLIKRSFDFHPRKNSTGSLDLNVPRRMQSPSSKPATGSYTRDNLMKPSASTVGRERSNAFNANSKMVRSSIVPSTHSFSEADELVCVEDYFSPEAMTSISTSQQLAAMTTSLREDSTTKGTKAIVMRVAQRELVNRPASGGSTKVSDSSLESTVYNNGVDLVNRFAGKGSNSERKDSELTQEGNTTRLPLLADKQKEEDILDEESRSRSISKASSNLKNLAALEDKVNALVSEGKNLEEQEVLSSSIGSRSYVRSVSISTFRKSSVKQSQGSDHSADGDVIKRCDSSSSIAILPTPTPQTDLTSLITTETIDSVARPVKFSIGTPSAEEPIFMTSDHTESRVVSPLSLNICTSMVSSVYDTSINTPPGTDMGTAPVSVIDANQPPASGGANVVIIGSTDSGHTSSSEDLTSIYDKPQFNSATKKVKSESKHKSKSSILLADDSHPTVTDPMKAPDDTNVGPETSYNWRSADYASLAGYGSDESSESEAEDLVPQYSFHHLNHHLTLYMMMSLFGNDEEFVCKIQSEIVQYMIEETYEGILVMSSSRFYILKITSDDHSLPPDQWLTCVEIQPIPELRYIDIGLAVESLRLEFVTDCSSYTLITRNRDKTSQFVELLHTNLAKYAVSQGISCNVVVNEDVNQITLNNLDIDVVSKVQPDQKMLLYCMGYIERGNVKHFPVSFVITSSDICLVRTNHQWPQPRLQAPITVETVGKQFTVLERQKINNVAAVEVCEATMKKIRLELFNEVEGISVNWNITLATRQTTVDFINSLSGPWAQEFGVEMEIAYAELDF